MTPPPAEWQLLIGAVLGLGLGWLIGKFMDWIERRRKR